MALKKAEISLSVTISGLTLGLGALFCGMVGDNWFKSIKTYKSYDKLNFGLLRMCVVYLSEATCYSRNILSFNSVDSWKLGYKEKLLDNILLTLIASSIFCLFGLIISLVMLFWCRGSKTHWRIIVFIDVSCILISACSAMGGASMSKAFILHNTSSSYFAQDWNSSVVWAGAICLIVSTFASALMIPYTPIDDAPKQRLRNARMFSHTFVDEEVRFNFILDEPARNGFRQHSESNAQASVHHHRPTRFIPLPVTSLENMNRYHILEDYTQYSDGSSEVSAPPTYDEAIDNTY